MVEREKIDFCEEDIKLAVEILKEVEDITDFFMFLKKERGVDFSYILLNSTCKESEEVIKEEKRNTDVVIELTNEYATLIICQETDELGSSEFAKRIIDSMVKKNEKSSSCASVLTINSQDVDNRDIIFSLMEDYLTLLKQPIDWRGGQMTFKRV